MPGEYAFEIDSNVGRYWLANGEGFDVVVERGRRVGVVEDVVLNPFTHEVSSVVVRRPLSAGVHRATQLPIDDLTAVLPASRRFLVTPDVPALTRHERRERLRAFAHGAAGRSRVRWWTLRRGTAIAARRTGHAVTGATGATADQVRAKWPTVRRLLAVAAARTGRAVANAAVVTAAFVEWAWRKARERLRESERKAHSRARRMR